MKQRCVNKNINHFHRYGGRGIKVYAKWLNNFKAFRDYMGEPPSPDHSVDRYPDRNGDYKPGNVRWATVPQQAANKDGCVPWGGELVSVAEASRLSGIPAHKVDAWRRFYEADLMKMTQYYNECLLRGRKRPNFSKRFTKRDGGAIHKKCAMKRRKLNPRKLDRWIKFRGITDNVGGWASRLKVTTGTMCWRLKTMPLRRALTMKKRTYCVPNITK